MRKTKILVILSTILLGLIMQTAAAYNLRFLNYSPVRYFSEQDWKLANTAVRKALNETKDGETLSWENPETKCSGTVTPITTETRNQVTCRELKIENYAKGLSGSANYRFCREPDGKWAVQQGTAATPAGTNDPVGQTPE
jgi:surface antigen